MLAYLSLLALFSDWICFSAAPIAPLVRRNFRVHDAHLVTCFSPQMSFSVYWNLLLLRCAV